MQSKHITIVLLSLMLLLVGCQERAPLGYEYFAKAPDDGWSPNDEFFFSTVNLDASTCYDVLLVLRLKQTIEYRSLPLGITKELPTRTFETKEVRVDLQPSSVKNSLKGYNIMELVTPLDKGVHFSNKGVYTYSVRHLSTDSLVQGVIEVGLIIHPCRNI